MQASSLGWYLHEQPAPLLKTKEKFNGIPMSPRGTHTHARAAIHFDEPGAAMAGFALRLRG